MFRCKAFLHWHTGEGVDEMELTDVPADYAAATHRRRSRRHAGGRWARARETICPAPAPEVKCMLGPLTYTPAHSTDTIQRTFDRDR